MRTALAALALFLVNTNAAILTDLSAVNGKSYDYVVVVRLKTAAFLSSCLPSL